ncbi:hypothetical protein CMI37_27335 [Candidatus Pacearchaeota archaeon]|nr:hypothetical protein [Candidatus Pacearchaeota archaeon]|tara:strand:- start:5574 stop:5987 length:414 start_codon:yes stop_codon:yes gene_type:complete
MADEAVLKWELEPAIPMTCSNTTGIEKGAILEISDPFTVATTNGDSDKIIGIAAEEKIANDGKTTIPVYLRGVFIFTAGAGGITVGRAFRTDTATGSANEVVIAAANEEGIIGTALETATDRETFYGLLNPINPVLA